MMSLLTLCLTAFLAQAEGRLPESTIQFLQRTDIETRLPSTALSQNTTLKSLLLTALTDLARPNETRYFELEEGLKRWTAYRRGLESIAQETRGIAENAVRQWLDEPGGKPGEVRVDPWKTVYQETEYFPFIETVDAPQQRMSFNVDGHSLARFIPPQFRLAEMLKAGTNSVHCEPIFINPSITFDSPTRYVVNNHVRHQFIGTFSLNPGRQRIETFQIYLDSRLKVPSGFVNIGEGVKLKHYQVGDIPFKAGYNYHHRRIPWRKERMNRNLASEGQRVLLSELESQRQQPLIDALEAELERRLKALKRQCLQSIHSGLNGWPEWSLIQSNVAALGGLLSEFHQAQDEDCLLWGGGVHPCRTWKIGLSFWRIARLWMMPSPWFRARIGIFFFI